VDIGAILRCFADLAERTANGPAEQPHGDVPPSVVDVTRAGEAPVWLGTSVGLPIPPGYGALPSMPRTDAVQNLATLDRLQPTEHLLRLGWVVVTGRIKVGDQSVGYCFPLISQPVVLERNVAMALNLTLRPVGEMVLTPLVTDAARGAALEENPQFGGGALDPVGGSEVTARLIARLPRLQSWVREVVAACGLPPVAEILGPDDDPLDHRSRVGLVACVGSLLYASRDVFSPRLDASLRDWSTKRGIGGTAFAAIYGGGQPTTTAGAPELLDSPFALSPIQHKAASRPRHERLTVISGPPGSGKTHTVAAIASDAVSRGESVLLATRSSHAADVVADMLARRPGPDPIRFGQAQGDDVAERATTPGITNAQMRTAENALAEARTRQALVEQAVAERLERERQAAAAGGWDTVLSQLTSVAPRAFHPTAEPERLATLLERAQASDASTWWRRTRARWAEGRLRRAVRADAATPLTQLALAVRAARDRRVAAELATSGGTTLAGAYADLDAADDAVLEAAGVVAAARADSEQRRRRGRAAAADLGALLRAGRRQRRKLLGTVDGPALVAALPLWVGTVTDVDDLLPRVPGLFDLVVLDEASQIDQIAGAGALLRGARGVVVGDPRQLRHVSFLSDEAVAAAVSTHGLDAHASRVDVRRASALDVAAGAATVTWLDEHFRSVPHLIEFSARRFYEGRLAVATRHPANESADAITTLHVDLDAPDAADQAKNELAAALDQIEHLAARGQRDIGVVTPFREIADALQAGIMERYDLDDVDRMGLRVGTVHAFQGSEADNVVLVLGLAPGDPVNRRRFVEDPNLFNVMVTRARRHLVVVTSLPAPTVATPAGLVDAFLAHADRPPRRVSGGTDPSPWAAALVYELRALGVEAMADYPVGRWVVEVCAGSGADALAVETAVHPDGAAAHIERHRSLRRTAWHVFDGYPSRWDGDATRAAFDVAEVVRSRGT
jgi:AAA domain